MPTLESTSLDATVQSIPYPEIVAFGKRLVATLDRGDSPDTTERWIAFHLADLIMRAKVAKPRDKSALERECVDLVFKLWTHRASIRGPHRPMKDFEGVFRYLERIAQDRPVYFELPSEDVNQRATEWLKLAEGLDYAARILIRWCVTNASLEGAKTDARWATDPVARVLADGEDTAASRVVLCDANLFHGIGKKPDEETAREQRLEVIRGRLDAILNMTKRMKDTIDASLGKKNKKRAGPKAKKARPS